MGFWQRIAINSLVFIALQYIMQGFVVSSVWIALIASIVLAFLNVLVKPVLSLLSFPITLLTFGLFSFVINALMLSLTSVLVGSGFYFSNFGTAFIVSLVLSLVQSFISDRRRY